MRPRAPSIVCKQLRMKEMLVGAVGIEPTTFGLKGRCSTTELRPCGFTGLLPVKLPLRAPLQYLPA